MRRNKKSAAGVQMTHSKDSLDSISAKTVSTFDGISADQMYREHILDHYKNPRNQGTLKDALHSHEDNPLCGDEIDMYIEIKDNKIKNISFTSEGCAISQASASMLTEYVKGKDIEKIAALSRESMQELLGIDVTAMRVKCMMLPLKAVKMIVFRQMGKQKENERMIEGEL